MPILKKPIEIWKRLLLRGTAFGGRHGKIRMLYKLEDPWEMASPREQHRFAETLEQLRAISPRYDNILEIGCGEGHQSQFLKSICNSLYGVDISETAIARAAHRCPEAHFSTGSLEDMDTSPAGRHYDLITACEVLYYAVDLADILTALQARTDRLYVSNYEPRSEKLRHLFQSDGWRPLDRIEYGETVWECFLWEAPNVLSTQTG